MAKKSKSQGEVKTVPPLKPNDPEIVIVGDEPEWLTQPDQDKRNLDLIKSLNWYNRFYDTKFARDIMRDYLKWRGEIDKAAQIARVSESQFPTSICWLARMNMRGLVLTETENERISNTVQHLLSLVKPVEKTETKNRVNIQEIMIEKARSVAGDIEGIFDDFLSAGAKQSPEKLEIMGMLQQQNIMPQHVNMIAEQWRKRRSEFEAISNDSDLAEGYRNFTRTQIKNSMKFCDAVITELGGYVTVKKAQKAPRKRKAVSPEKQASKLQHLKKHDELKLQSVAPAKIIGANEVWAYDTAKRKLWYFVADQHAGSLGIKGTAIVGFDSAASGMKTLRKPAEQLREFMSAGKPASRKLFKEIKSVQAQLRGRTNQDLLILKVY